MNITYYIGAGASAEAIPTVKYFNERLRIFINFLIHRGKEVVGRNEILFAFLNQVVEDFPKHYSIDTYARKLFFHDEKRYEALKLLLSYYFLFEQLDNSEDIFSKFKFTPEYWAPLRSGISTKVDKRYDVLYAALLKHKTRNLSDSISVISWNYDLQFELGLSLFLSTSINNSFDILRTYPTPNKKSNDYLTQAKFIRLNGIAGMYYVGKENSYKLLMNLPGKVNESSFDNAFSTLADVLINGKENYDSLFEFAWEDEHETREARNKARSIIQETDTLVIIGYSFPVYNRKIDKQVIDGPARFNKTYLQVNAEHFESYKARIKNVSARLYEKVEPYSELEQFYIPDELLME